MRIRHAAALDPRTPERLGADHASRPHREAFASLHQAGMHRRAGGILLRSARPIATRRDEVAKEACRRRRMRAAGLRPVTDRDRTADQGLEVVRNRARGRHAAPLGIAARIGDERRDVAAAAQGQPLLAADRTKRGNVDDQSALRRRTEEPEGRPARIGRQNQRRSFTRRLQVPALGGGRCRLRNGWGCDGRITAARYRLARR